MHIAKLVETIRKLESELELELAKHSHELAFTVRGGVGHFEERVLQRHRQLRIGLARYLIGARPLLLLTAPVIYAPLLAFVLLDGFVSVYQAICFPIYGIARVRRHDYLIFDRFPLAYLNLIERINCWYCSYANGLIAYVREIASRTEQYWCPIKHARRVIAAHDRYPKFVDYGDAENYQRELTRLRRELQQEREP